MTVAPTLAERSFRLNRRAGAGPALPGVLLLTDAVRLPDPLPAAAALPPGSGVIVRHHDVDARAALAGALKRLCRARRLRLLIANDWRLAAAVGADGVHLAEARLPRAPVAAFRARGWLVTAAAHGPPALWRAARAGADAALLSPVFATASHPGAAALGPCRFAALARRAPLPVYALGGITGATAVALEASAAAGLAAIAGLTPAAAAGRTPGRPLPAARPATAARECVEA